MPRVNSRALNSRLRLYRCFLGLLPALTLCAAPVDEYQVKAAFIYNFARFVEWQPEIFRGEKDPIRICVLGHDPFGGSLSSTVEHKAVDGRLFAVGDVATPAEAAGCQVLFVSSSERKRIAAILSAIPTAGVLTIGEVEGFTHEGGIVNFKLENGKVRFEVNVEAAARARLRISSKVLELAELVK